KPDDVLSPFRHQERRPVGGERLTETLVRIPVVEQPQLYLMGNDTRVRDGPRRASDSLDVRKIHQVGMPDYRTLLAHTHHHALPASGLAAPDTRRRNAMKFMSRMVTQGIEIAVCTR